NRGVRGGQNRNNAQGTSAPAPAAPAVAPTPAPTPAPASSQTAPQGAAPTMGQSDDRGRGGFRGGSGGGGGRGGVDPARMMERFKGMSPDEQTQFIARVKDRGQDTSAFEKEMKGTKAPANALRTKYGAPASAQTIDALFAPLPAVETRGRAWLFINHELKPVNLRLGVSDGTNTE